MTKITTRRWCKKKENCFYLKGDEAGNVKEGERLEVGKISHEQLKIPHTEYITPCDTQETRINNEKSSCRYGSGAGETVIC